MRLIEFRQSFARFMRKRHGRMEFLSEPSLTMLGDALWVLCDGDPEQLPDVMRAFLNSPEFFDAEGEDATYVITGGEAA